MSEFKRNPDAAKILLLRAKRLAENDDAFILIHRPRGADSVTCVSDGDTIQTLKDVKALKSFLRRDKK